MSYGKIYDDFWDEDDKIERLSDDAVIMAAFIFSGKHRNAIGCFKLGMGAITDIQRFGGWGIDRVSKALLALSEVGLIVRDDRTGWTLIVNTLKRDPITGPKAAVHAAKIAYAVPTNSIVYPALKEKLESQLAKEEKALSKCDGWPMRAPSYTTSIPRRFPEPKPEPQPEPEPSVPNGTVALRPEGELFSRETPAEQPVDTKREDELLEIPLQMVAVTGGDYGMALWKFGAAYVRRVENKDDASARSLIGKWRGVFKDDAKLWSLLVQADREKISHLPSWLGARAPDRTRSAATGEPDDGLTPTTRAIIAESQAAKGTAA